MHIPTLNIIGAGRLGQTLGRLFHVHDCFKINGVCNSHLINAQKAVEFIGAGLACSTLDQLPPAENILIATPDAMIETVALALTNLEVVQQCHVVFHCSGATLSSGLSPLKHEALSIASVHPNMTFASAHASVDHFSGTYCAFEGDNSAFELLESAFRKIGGKVFQIAAEKKPIYHAATVMSCNHLIALLDIAVELYEQVEISREVALSIMQPIVNKTVSNTVTLGTVGALTGPIARGDIDTVRGHISALQSPYIKDIYKRLAQRLIKLASDKGDADAKELNAIEMILNS